MGRDRIWWAVLAVVLGCSPVEEASDALAGTQEGALVVATAAFRAHYLASFADTAWCVVDSELAGHEPAGTGRYPVFIYTVGTLGNHAGPEADLIVRQMAARGFVAASAQYQNFFLNACTPAVNKTRCIYDPGSARSAVAQLCARPRADCSKGIVVGGMSQGGQLALLARNFDPRVSAAWVMGGTNVYHAMSRCVDAGPGRALPGDRTRVINGDQDVFAYPWTMSQLTGKWCAPGADECFNGNGSGWRRVRGDEVSDGGADHCFFTTDHGCTNSPSFDPGWAPPAAHAWSLGPNLDWLKSMAGR